MSTVTAQQVADLVGVSLSTVSRALSAPDLVSPATLVRVQAAVRQLGYHPNRAASTLATGRTTSIGLVVPDLENPYFASVAKGVQSRAWSTGYTVMVADSDEDPVREAEVVKKLSRQVDGVVLCSPRSTDAVVRDLASRVRLVLLNRQVDDLPSVSVDNAATVRTAVEHLRALGHRRIAYAGGPQASWVDLRRREGLQHCSEAFQDVEIIDLGHFRPHYTGGIAAADLALASNATAVLAYNDLLALGLIGQVRQRGFGVPQRLSVIGFDGLAIGALFTPTLTSVGVAHARLGSLAVSALLEDLSSGPGGFLQHQTPFELLVRESTAEPLER
ncbi:LacI family DNA-binding transcriptional regulator [Kineococcus rhizosphaerae]|nr:LacI family DNA-binding transcriptional regulator [Kineococcus rhizosphaerae]